MTRIVDPEIGFGDQFQRNNIHFMVELSISPNVNLSARGGPLSGYPTKRGVRIK